MYVKVESEDEADKNVVKFSVYSGQPRPQYSPPPSDKKKYLFSVDYQGNAHYINDKFYYLSQQKGLELQVEYADICPVPDKSAHNEEYLLDAFANSIQNYYNKKVLPVI